MAFQKHTTNEDYFCPIARNELKPSFSQADRTSGFWGCSRKNRYYGWAIAPKPQTIQLGIILCIQKLN